MAARLKEAYGWLENRNAALSQKIEEVEEKRTELEKTKTAMLNLLEDINEEKEISQNRVNELQKFQLAVENASDQIVIADPDGIILYANKAVTNISGFSIEEIIGKKAGVLWGKQMPLEFYRKMWKTIKTDKKVFVSELTNKRKDGEEYIAEVRIAPIMDETGNVIFFVCIQRDITKAKEVDRAKTEFVSLASHQLRTPLTAIKWYIERLLSEELGKYNKKQKQYLDEVYHSNQRMITLINALLNVSRIEMGTLEIAPEPTVLKKIFQSVISELLPQIEKKGLKIEEDYDERVPIVSVDPDLTRIIFQNLLSNSVKYTPEKGRIAVEIKRQAEDVFIRISDTGIGIPRSQQPKIFDKFVRGDNAKEVDQDGTGLGLYIVKAVVERTGGKIWFESEENKGTTFFVTIPLKGMEKKEGTRKLEE
jgi:PAS domain S-box-containing protein